MVTRSACVRFGKGSFYVMSAQTAGGPWILRPFLKLHDLVTDEELGRQVLAALQTSATEEFPLGPDFKEIQRRLLDWFGERSDNAIYKKTCTCDVAELDGKCLRVTPWSAGPHPGLHPLTERATELVAAWPAELGAAVRASLATARAHEAGE